MMNTMKWDSLVHRTLDVLKKQFDVRRGDTLLAAVSGGADVSGGYTVNGEAGLHAGYATFRLTVEEDTVISVP